jgi:uncharacterized protein YgfB (UPF0149 family)
MIMDHYKDRWPQQYPWVNPYIDKVVTPFPGVTREEFDALKKEVREMIDLLKRAKAYDAEHNQPDCETAEKVEFIRKIAELMEVDLSEVLA